MTKDVSIIIVNYNTRQMTSECIDSVIAKTKGLDYEIILVDNASTDGSKEFFSQDKRVTYIYNDENLGFGRANNKGIELSKGRNILFLNSDTLLMNNAILIMSEYLDSHITVGVCGGNLFTEDGNPGFSFSRYFPSKYEEFSLLFGLFPDKLRFGRNANFNHTEKPLKISYPIGADMMIKKSVIDEVGAFDNCFFLYYEETELCLRVHRAQYEIISIPNAKIIHFGGSSTAGNKQCEIEKFKQMENSREFFYSLAYNEKYKSSADFLRKLKLYCKSASPVGTTRKAWKEKKDVYKSIWLK